MCINKKKNIFLIGQHCLISQLKKLSSEILIEMSVSDREGKI